MPTNDDAGPFSIGQNIWPGLAKLAEECGEVIQIIGKLIATGGDRSHWSGLDLKVELENEIADVLASADFTILRSSLDGGAISSRRHKKLALFEEWHNAS